MMRSGIQLICFLSLGFLLISCGSSGNKTSDSSESASVIKSPAASLSAFEGPAQVLLQQLQDQGDYVNSRQYPSMIKAETVFAELNENNHILDIRAPEKYQQGHIKGAVNLKTEDLLSYFENDIIPFKYDKIILVCNGGQRTSFATGLLRLMGYGNVYSMRWGMSGWHEDFSAYLWERILSSEYQDQLQKESVEKPSRAVIPQFETSAEDGEAMLRERVETLLKINPSEVFISSKEVFSDPGAYYIINWERKDKYEAGHIPGALRYKPQGTLGIPSEMGSLPTDQPIVLYCGTGMSSAFAASYLRLFGYDARSLRYGNNSFMHQKMLDEKESLSWQPFTKDTPGNYDYVKN